MSQKALVVAIDGPAASGKSTTARLVAERLGYQHLDTGAMYRAVTLKVLRAGVRPGDEHGIAKLLETTRVQLAEKNGEQKVLLDGEDVTREIRSDAVTKGVSDVSSLGPVRAAMVREQRRMGEGGGIVLEGRDIGTVVFPDADVKIFMVAGIEARALRRQKELKARGRDAALDVLIGEIAERDAKDSGRSRSPLRKASDAVEVDTTGMTIDEQVDLVVGKVREKLRGVEAR